MNPMVKKALAFAALLSIAPIVVASCGVAGAVPFVSFRSQSWNHARELAGWADKINLCGMDDWYATFKIVPEYTQSFKNQRIARALFGDCGINGGLANNANNCCDFDRDDLAINITGSGVANRGANDWLADYFGLPANFQSTITFRPRVQNFLIDFNFFIGFDFEYLCLHDLWFRVHAPFVHTRWRLGFREDVVSSVSTNTALGVLPAGFESITAIPASQLLTSAGQFFVGQTPPACATAAAFFGKQTCTGLQSAKIDPCKKVRTKNGLAEIQAALGWNFWCCEDYHLGAGIRVCAPTGNRPKGVWVFEPIVGNGKHWELGGMITSHYTFWRSDCEDRSFGLYVDANILHQFKARQRRTFDLINNGPNSRYIQIAQINAPNPGDLFLAATAAGPATIEPPFVFNNVFSTVADISTINVKVGAGVQAEVVAMFSYQSCNFTWDLGYDFWARSCEKISLDCKCGTPVGLDGATWVLKGDAQVFGFAQAGNNAGLAAGTPIALSFSERCATIHAGTNGSNSSLNSAVDNALPAFVLLGGTSAVDQIANGAGLAPINASNGVHYLSVADLDIPGARTRGLSNKLFTNLGYQWKDCECWLPYVGIGAEVEWGMNNNRHDNNSSSSCNTNCSTITSCYTNVCSAVTNAVSTINSCSSNSSCDTSCHGCRRISLSQWGVWLQGGVSF